MPYKSLLEDEGGGGPEKGSPSQTSRGYRSLLDDTSDSSQSGGAGGPDLPLFTPDIGAQGKDILYSGATGLAHGLGDIAGIPGDAFSKREPIKPDTTDPNLLRVQGDPNEIAAARLRRGVIGRRDVTTPEDESRVTHGHMPTSGDIRQTIDPYLHQPETKLGEGAEQLGRYSINAATPGGILRKGAAVALPAIGESLGRHAAPEVAKAFGKELDPETGAVIGSVLGGLPSSVKGRRGKMPDIADVKREADLGYQVARGAGSVIPIHAADLANEVDRIVDPGAGILRTRGHLFSPEGKATVSKLGELENVPKPDASVVMEMIRELRDEGRYGDAGRRAAKSLQDFLEKGAPGSHPMMKPFLDEFKTADKNWAAQATAQEIDEAIATGHWNAKVSGKGGNLNNTLKQAANRLLKSAKADFYTPEVTAMLQKAAAGGAGATEKLLRWVSMLAPTGIVSLFGGYELGGIKGLAAGFVAKKLAEGRTSKAFRQAQEGALRASPYGQQPQFQAPPRRIVLPAAVNAILARTPTESNGGP